MKQIVVWPEVIRKPSEFDYFTRLIITGVENKHEFSFNLKSHNLYLCDFCGKTLKGETLEQSIKRDLFQCFGVEKIIEYDYQVDQEYANDKNGNELPRVIVEVKLDKNQIKNKNFNDYQVFWKDKFQYLSKKIYDNPAIFEYFIILKIQYIDNLKNYIIDVIPSSVDIAWQITSDEEQNYVLWGNYVGRVHIGETLEQGINRELKTEFGINELIKYQPDPDRQDNYKNRFGEIFPRVKVFLEVDPKQIKLGESPGGRFVSSILNEYPFKFKEIKKQEKNDNHDLLLSILKKNKYSMEALDYIKYGGILAPNRFSDSIKAKNFVKKLYKLGAIKVKITSIELETDDWFGADSLDVSLPSDINKRINLINLCNKEEAIEGFDQEEDKTKDTGQDSIDFWWD